MGKLWQAATLIGLSGLAVGVGIAFGRATSPAQAERREPSASVADQGDTLEALRRDLSRVEGKLGALALRGEASGTSAKAHEVASETPASAAASPTPGPRAAEEERATMQARATFLQEALRREARDGAWADGAERVVSDALREARREGVALLGVECHTSTCRLDLTYDTPERRAEHADDLGDQLPQLAGASFVYEDGPRGEPRLVAYTARPGHRPPRFSPNPQPDPRMNP
jgi:hypothetical protein